ncbi:MAG TPA: nucleotidyltransferase domain-containing protein [Actinomycetota bacterium]|nr:nucleotidyltransferase domain-containing protein [Actinomycetota bacterium]
MRVFWLDRAEALQRLRAAASRLVERPDVRAVYLFGSLAQDRAVPGSDADVLVLLERSDRRWVDRPLEFGPWFDGVGMPVELFCYTPEEADRAPLARTARETGIALAVA